MIGIPGKGISHYPLLAEEITKLVMGERALAEVAR